MIKHKIIGTLTKLCYLISDNTQRLGCDLHSSVVFLCSNTALQFMGGLDMPGLHLQVGSPVPAVSDSSSN